MVLCKLDEVQGTDNSHLHSKQILDMYILHQFLNQRMSDQNFHSHHLNIPDNIITKLEGNNMLRRVQITLGATLANVRILRQARRAI
jgi:hypothetical protein